MALDIFILGTGGMLPLPNRFLVSVFIRHNGSCFLFDCGEGTQVALKKIGLKWKKIESIFVTHMHADHVTGLPGLLMLNSQVDRQEKLDLFGPPPLKNYVDHTQKYLEMYINYPLNIHEIKYSSEKQEIWSNSQLSITCFHLHHSKECVAYSVEEKEKPGVFSVEKACSLKIPQGPLWSQLQHGEKIFLHNRWILPSEVLGTPRQGLKFVYVTDTLYFPSLVPFVAQADLLLIEGMFEQDLLSQAKKKKHMTAPQSAEIARLAKVKKMGLLHYSPRYNKIQLKSILKEAQSVFPHCFLSYDGQYINLT